MWDAIEKKVKRGERLSGEEGLFLYQQGDILALGELARLVAERRHRKVVYYIVNRHINPTNICVNRCRFCAFSRSEGESGAYELTLDEMIQQVVCAYKGGATEVHIV
jgi:aminodeoxyfutalosine synthase